MKKILYALLLTVNLSCNDKQEKEYLITMETLMVIYERGYMKGSTNGIKSENNFKQDFLERKSVDSIVMVNIIYEARDDR